MSTARIATRFRAALLLYIALLSLATIVMIYQIGYSEALAEYLASQPEPFLAEDFGNQILVLAVALFFLAFFASVVGLYFFKKWSRALALWSTVAFLPMYFVFDPTAGSAVESVLYDASNMLWGAILVAAYLSPAAVCFERTRSLLPHMNSSEDSSLSP